MKTAVLVLNYNGREFLDECLESLGRQTRAPDRVLVVDNGSADGSEALVAERLPGAALLRLERNFGFAGGNNRGLQWLREQGPFDAVALLNNDARAEPQWLESLTRCLETDPGAGSVASLMLYASEPGQVNNAGDMPLLDGTGLARGRHRPAGEFDSAAEVFGACGGAVLYRWRALEQAAMDGEWFDSHYFAYNEDVDLSWRLRHRGWTSRFAPDARVLHRHGGTQGRRSLWVLYHGERNRCWTLVKNFSWWLIFVSPLYTLARLSTIALRSGKAGSTAAGYLEKSSVAAVAGTLMKAWLAALAGTPAMLWKRWKYGWGWRLGAQREVLKRFGARLSDAAGH